MKIRNIICFSIILICIIANPVKNVVSITENTDSTENNPYPILFVHGYSLTGSSWDTMKDRFLQDGWPRNYLSSPTYSLNTRYDYNANIAQANDVKTFVDNLLTYTGATKVNIIAHSMGTTVARYYIKFLGGIDKVNYYISLGGDHHGAPASDNVPISLPPNASIYLDLNEGDETPGGVLSDTVGSRPDPFGSPIWNGTHVSGDINYYSIYNEVDKYIIDKSAALDGAVNIELKPGPGHDGLLSDASVYSMVKSILNGTYKSKSNNIPGFTFMMIIAIPVILTLKKNSRLH